MIGTFGFYVGVLLLKISSIIHVVCRVFHCVCVFSVFRLRFFLFFSTSLILPFPTDDLPLNAMNKLLEEPSAQLKISVRHFPLHTLRASVTLSRHFIIIIILEGKQNDFVSNI
jgi:hypothetical protein